MMIQKIEINWANSERFVNELVALTNIDTTISRHEDEDRITLTFSSEDIYNTSQAKLCPLLYTQKISYAQTTEEPFQIHLINISTSTKALYKCYEAVALEQCHEILTKPLSAEAFESKSPLLINFFQSSSLSMDSITAFISEQAKSLEPSLYFLNALLHYMLDEKTDAFAWQLLAKVRTRTDAKKYKSPSYAQKITQWVSDQSTKLETSFPNWKPERIKDEVYQRRALGLFNTHPTQNHTPWYVKSISTVSPAEPSAFHRSEKCMEIEQESKLFLEDFAKNTLCEASPITF